MNDPNFPILRPADVARVLEGPIGDNLKGAAAQCGGLENLLSSAKQGQVHSDSRFSSAPRLFGPDQYDSSAASVMSMFGLNGGGSETDPQMKAVLAERLQR